MSRALISGTGHYAPEKVLTNDELSQRIETSDEWIRSRTGIRARHVAAEGEQASDMATVAARRALEMAGRSPKDVDLLIVGTISGDMPMPACAAFVQAKLDCHAPVFDLSAACAGSLYGMSVAEKFIRTGDAKCAVVIGVELLTRLLDWNDRNTCVLFGDAAGAMVLTPSSDDRRGIMSTHLHADGRLAEILSIPGGGTRSRMSPENLAKNLDRIHMNGREVYKIAVRSLADVAQEAMDANRVSAADVTHVVPHQANIRIVEAVLDKLGIPMDKAHLNIDRYGNTSSASVPVTLDEGVRSGRIQPGDVVLMMAIGAGMAWGSALLRW